MSNSKSLIFLKSSIALPINGADISMFERLSKHKRVDIFFEIAKNMPGRKFLLAGGMGHEYRERKDTLGSFANLELIPREAASDRTENAKIFHCTQ